MYIHTYTHISLSLYLYLYISLSIYICSYIHIYKYIYCITNLYNKVVQLEVRRTFSDRGMGMDQDSSKGGAVETGCSA